MPSPIQQCVVFPLFKPDSMPLDLLCGHASRIGYTAIKMWGRKNGPGGGEHDFAEVVDTARRHDLRLVSFIGHDSLDDGLNNPASHDRSLAELERSIELARAHNVPNVIAFAGNRIDGQSDLEGTVECSHALRRAASAAERAGININLELLNSRVDHPGYLGDHTDWGIALCEMVASARVKLLFDIYHMQIMEGDVIRWIRRALPHIGHFHTAGNPGRREMDDAQELNYRGISNAIAATDYAGYVGHELDQAGDTVAELEQCYSVCDV